MKPSTLENTRSLDYRPSVPTNIWFPSNCDFMTINNFEEYDEPMKRMGNATTAPGIPLRLRQSVRTFPRGRGQACMEGGTPPYDPWCLDTIPYKPGRGPCARKASLGRARMVGRTPHTGHIPRLRGPFAWTVLNSHCTVWAWLYLSVKRVSRIHAHTTYRVILSPSMRNEGFLCPLVHARASGVEKKRSRWCPALGIRNDTVVGDGPRAPTGRGSPSSRWSECPLPHRGSRTPSRLLFKT